jgi:glutaminase
MLSEPSMSPRIMSIEEKEMIKMPVSQEPVVSVSSVSRLPDQALQPATNANSRELHLFRSLDLQRKGEIAVSDLLDALRSVGLNPDDARLAETTQKLEKLSLRDKLSYSQFCDLVRPNILLIDQALQGNMVIPDFDRFREKVTEIFSATKQNRTGNVADYIPQLARVLPDQCAISICTVDGQMFSLGESQIDFCVQSCCKPINYCLALEEHGEAYVRKYVGREPSGRNFNELALNDEGKPHNPMVNAGAIMCSALIRSDLDNADRFDFVLQRWATLCGGHKPRFSNSIYQSERETADRNFALGYYMNEHKAFPEGVDLLQTLDFYFQCCSIEANAEMLSVLTATLANGGVCPTNGERVMRTEHVQHCLSLMCSCGMYDFSGEFAFEVGLPAKSGVGGAILLAIPNVMGICIWSPRLDAHGNSVRGVEFCRRLVSTFSLHNFDNLKAESTKIDPRQNGIQSKAERVDELIWAASTGDVGAIHRLVVRGYDQNAADYDGRTPLHLAAAEGRIQLVRYFLENGAEPNPKDRWGGTPLDDAVLHGHGEVASLLNEHGGTLGRESQPDSRPTTDPVATVGNRSQPRGIVELIYAASEGDLCAIQRLVARAVDLAGADYDMRTPIHLAAAEGEERIVQFFIDQGVELSPRDRWGNTPLDEAKRHGHARVTELLRKSTGRTLAPRT